MDPDALWTIIETCTWHTVYTPLIGALSFGFFGFLRISNLAPQTAADFDPKRHTTVGNVLMQTQGLILNLKWSKTRQNCRNAISIPLPALGRSLLCPLKAWITYMRQRQDIKITVDSPLLLNEAGKPITIPVLRRLFHDACELAGMADVGYTPHSLRRGGGGHLCVPRWRTAGLHQASWDLEVQRGGFLSVRSTHLRDTSSCQFPEATRRLRIRTHYL